MSNACAPRARGDSNNIENRMRIISTNSRGQRWSWIGGGIGLGLVAVVCVLLYATNDRTTPDSKTLKVKETSAVPPSDPPTVESTVAMGNTPPQFPRLDFPVGSVEEACALNEFPSYWVAYEKGTRGEVQNRALESVECQTALENSIKTSNPYLWNGRTHEQRAFAFVELDEPLTFERIFSDPAGDLARVQDALSRPECLLKGEKKNWELKEICHAESFFNYALINHLCFDGGYWRRNWPVYYSAEDNPTLEQDRVMWKQSLEVSWLGEKCEQLDTTLKITEIHPSLLELMPHRNFSDDDAMRFHTEDLLTKLAARLGDDAAGLTERRLGFGPPGGGGQYGKFAELLVSEEWQSLIKAGATWRAYDTQWSVKELSMENFLRAFNLLARFDNTSREQHDEIQFDWQAVVQHLCVPTYERPVDEEQMGIKRVEYSTCKEVVHEIRQKGIIFPPLVKMLDKFEQVALELDVYE